jgi:hypothetical protein
MHEPSTQFCKQCYIFQAESPNFISTFDALSLICFLFFCEELEHSPVALLNDLKPPALVEIDRVHKDPENPCCFGPQPPTTKSVNFFEIPKSDSVVIEKEERKENKRKGEG